MTPTYHGICSNCHAEHRLEISSSISKVLRRTMCPECGATVVLREEK
jgi:DNA-directed RNA polymerase subunit RPC12/RpoP